MQQNQWPRHGHHQIPGSRQRQHHPAQADSSVQYRGCNEENRRAASPASCAMRRAMTDLRANSKLGILSPLSYGTFEAGERAGSLCTPLLAARVSKMSASPPHSKPRDVPDARPSNTFWDVSPDGGRVGSVRVGSVRSSIDMGSVHSDLAASSLSRARSHSPARHATPGLGHANDLPRADRAYDDMTSVHGEVQIPDLSSPFMADGQQRSDGGGGGGAEESDDAPRPPFSWRLLWAYTGPGWLMSIAYLDPGNLESDLQAGAYTGYQLVWVLFWSTVLGLVLQILAARLGVVTGKHLAQLCREQYRPLVSRSLWLMTELAIIGSDIQEVIGSAIAFKILFGLPLWVGVLITAADTFTFLGLHAFGVRKLEAFFAVLIATMSVCFFIEVGVVRPSFSETMGGFLPDVSDYAVIQAVSILGAVIMPHNIYLHSALVQSRAVDRTRPSKVREANFYFSIEAAVALAVSFLINLAVVCVFAKGFFNKECAEQGLALVSKEGIIGCETIGLEEAGDALSELLGNSASKVWAVGLLAAGQSSTMTGTFAGQYVMEGFLTLRIAAWKRVFLTRMLALLPAVGVALIAKDRSSSHVGDVLDEYLNILQSIQLPFALLPLLHFTSSKRIMGRAFVNSPKFRIFGWCVVSGITAINMYLVVSQIFDVSVSGLPDTPGMYVGMSIIFAAYLVLLAVIIRKDAAFGLVLLKRCWAKHISSRHSGGHAANVVPSEDGAEPLSLEDEYDRPEWGSPAWEALERAAGRLPQESPDMAEAASGAEDAFGQGSAADAAGDTPAGDNVDSASRADYRQLRPPSLLNGPDAPGAASSDREHYRVQPQDQELML